MRERTATLIGLLLLLLLFGCGGDGGAEAYREGRFEEAYALLSEEVETEGESASPELLYNHALAALRVGEPRLAQFSADKALGRGGEAFGPRCRFVLGNAAFAQALNAERQADTPEAEPFAFDVAIRYAGIARDSWALAAAIRVGWPEAERNVERALTKLQELGEKRAAAEERNKPRTAPKPDPLPLPGGGDQKVTEDGVPEALLTRLTEEQVLALIERLGEKEREKLTVRRAHRRERMRDVEKDW